jgi:hypothetical protein
VIAKAKVICMKPAAPFQSPISCGCIDVERVRKELHAVGSFLSWLKFRSTRESFLRSLTLSRAGEMSLSRRLNSMGGHGEFQCRWRCRFRCNEICAAFRAERLQRLPRATIDEGNSSLAVLWKATGPAQIPARFKLK